MRIGGECGAAFVDAPRLHFAFGGFLFTHFDEFKIGLLRDDVICAKGSPGRKICARPSAGDLKTTKNIIGHQFRISAGTAIGTLSVGSV